MPPITPRACRYACHSLLPRRFEYTLLAPAICRDDSDGTDAGFSALRAYAPSRKPSGVQVQAEGGCIANGIA